MAHKKTDACKLGSTTLLNWMWGCCPTSATDRTPHWSLTNYLRSDPHYYQYQFQGSVLVATKVGDLRVLEWLMEHFSGCEVPESVVEVAASEGRLEILQFLLDHGTGRPVNEGPCRKKRKVNTTAGREPMPEKEPESRGHGGGGNVVKWGGRGLVAALEANQLDIVRFLYESTPHGVTGDLCRSIEALLNFDEEKLADLLLPEDDSDWHEWLHAADPIVIEVVFDAGLLGDEFLAAVAIQTLVRYGRLDLMKKIWKEHAQLASTGGWMDGWVRGMSTACKTGDLPILRWMVEHPSGRAVIAYLKQYDEFTPLLYHATNADHLDVMEYLYRQGVAEGFGRALRCAIRRDNMDAVKWLLKCFPASEQVPEYCVLVEAARHGRVEMLQYLQSAVSLEVPGFPGSYLKGMQTPATDSKWRPTDAMDDAAANGHLEAVRWLHENRSEGCTTNAMGEAAASGQLEVLKWLHANRSEGSTDKAIFYAALEDRTEVVKWLVTQSPKDSKNIAMKHAVSNGNLALVQWLHSKAKARCTAKVMIRAAKHGHLEVLQYLYSRRPKGPALTSCAVAVEKALAGGHFRVAHWCLEHFPVRRPMVTNAPYLHPFESLLLLRWYYPESFKAENGATIQAILKLRARATTDLSFIAKWFNTQVSGS